jgi:hypothetical protein
VGDPSSHVEQFEIDSHIFVPVYLGPAAYTKLSRPEKSSPWIVYKELKIENDRLCVLKNGIGVWHLTRHHSFHTLVEAASWRKEFYARVFEKNWLQASTNNLLDETRPAKEAAVFKPILGKAGYAYSVMVLKSPRWKDLNKARRVLQILACPKPLEAKNESTPERERVRSLERQLLEHGLGSRDLREFGLAGEDMGYASWEGLSVYPTTAGLTATEILINLQIAVHSLWWFSKCLADIWLSNPDFATVELSRYLSEIKKQLLVLKNIGAKESTSQRTMNEAVMSVNRLDEIVEETLALYG